MAAWWSSESKGKTIFYKLPEHLASQYKAFKARQVQRQTMVATQPLRKPNEDRIQSTAHIAQVLPAISVFPSTARSRATKPAVSYPTVPLQPLMKICIQACQCIRVHWKHISKWPEMGDKELLGLISSRSEGISNTLFQWYQWSALCSGKHAPTVRRRGWFEY
ncbi:hypothetical protein C8R45DRAFT_923963 [Mycena sanguinolenta]|nr:hypothetical protein C8R45DRAFT_923963 [Mycena sanguinolenta]